MAKDDWLLTGEIYAVVSSPASNPRGSGKSLVAIQLALAQANLLNYGLCFNFDINADALYKFCLYKGYYNVIRQLKNGNVRVRSVVVNDPKKELLPEIGMQITSAVAVCRLNLTACQ